MAAIKSASQIAGKWADVTPQRAGQYQEGVRNPKTSWAAAAAASEDRYKAGVIDAANKGRFGAGVKKAGDSRWQERSANVGPQRFAEGVATSGERYAVAIAPYVDVIARTTLPVRYPKGDPRNLDRVKAIAAALRAKKVGG